jgi:DNA polymerase-3 subunit delta
MLFKEFVSKLASVKNLPAAYLFSGREDFLKQQGLKALQEKLSPPDNPMPVKRFSSQDFNEASFWDELYLVPFDSKKRLVILDIRNHQLIETIINELEKYLEAKSPFSVLALLIQPGASHGAPARSSGGEDKISRLTDKHGWVIDCQPIPEYDLPRWVAAELKRYNKTISRENAKLLIESTGNDLVKIDALINKLATCSANNPEISSEIMSNLVEKDADYDIKELGNAIINKNSARAIEILDRLLVKGEASPRIMGYLRWFFGYYQEHRLLGERYKQLLETDLSIKTGRMPEELALRTMVLKLAMMN